MALNLSIGSDGPDSPRIALLMIVVGVVVAGYGGYDYTQQSDAVENAVEVGATVVETGIEESSSRRGGTEYRPAVEFEYRYDGANYTGTDVYPASTQSNFDTEDAARSVLDGYGEGERVTAYVDPSAPSEGFLKAQESNAPMKVAGLGVLFALFGVVSVLRS
ncbi:DUF3592 domain-containing protein [Halobellus rarus]|uniref:DUF3592 domain-containing protein n=1 Tax=Halobellus rarus TaxID=1126237 RepID=A0ABD6CP13_9EURY